MIINDNEDINIDKVTSEIVECLSFALVTEKITMNFKLTKTFM